MSRTSEGKFDGELVITADREIMPEQPLMVSLIDYKTEEKATPGPLLLEYLAVLEEIRLLAEEDDQTPEGKYELRHKKLIGSALVEIMAIHERVMSPKMLRLVTEGRLKTAIWVDSEGGSVPIAEKVKFAVDYIRRQELGTFTSYVNIKAASAAFDLAFLASEVHAMTKSVFNWHFSDSDENPRIEKVRKFRAGESLDDEAEAELVELRDILEDATPEMKDEVWRHAIRQLNDANNKEGDIYFEGDFLHEAGLVNSVSRKVDGLIAQFESDFPLHADKNATFFTAGVAERVQHLLKNQPYWLDPRALALTSRVARQYEKPKPKKAPAKVKRSK